MGHYPRKNYRAGPVEGERAPVSAEIARLRAENERLRKERDEALRCNNALKNVERDLFLRLDNRDDENERLRGLLKDAECQCMGLGGSSCQWCNERREVLKDE